MKRRIVALASALIVAVATWAATITIGVPVQLLEGQSNQLPDKNIETTLRQVKIKDNAPVTMAAAIDSVTHMVSENAGNCRTFALMINPQAMQVDVFALDPTEMPQGDAMGTLVTGYHHFVVLTNDNNKPLLDQVFKTAGEKVKYVREFEFVEEIIEIPATHVTAVIENGNVKVTNRMVEGMDAE